eukprot:scaffold177592_cov33-Prasinocladus_malaysianus.AAC.1
MTLPNLPESEIVTDWGPCEKSEYLSSIDVSLSPCKVSAAPGPWIIGWPEPRSRRRPKRPAHKSLQLNAEPS